MIVDGKNIAARLYTEIEERVRVLGRTPVLAIITCAPNFETQKYLALKEKKAHLCGIETKVIQMSESSTTDEVLKSISESIAISDGIIVQLPLPPHMQVEEILASIPESHDVDMLNTERGSLLSPVVGACSQILAEQHIAIVDKFVTIIGSGRLVGLPAYRWFIEQGAHVSVVTKDTDEIAHYTRNADIIVCGAGVPGLITPDMIKEGVIILDAGTSEDGGELRGDALPTCALKSSLFTPVPGGIGPITIAILLKNVVDCAYQNDSMV